MRLDDTAEIVSAENEHVGVLHRDHVGRTRLLIDQGELAEVLAWTEHAEDHLAAVLTDEHDFDTTITDDEQRITRIVLEKNDAAFWIALLTRELREAP